MRPKELKYAGFLTESELKSRVIAYVKFNKLENAENMAEVELRTSNPLLQICDRKILKKKSETSSARVEVVDTEELDDVEAEDEEEPLGMTEDFKYAPLSVGGFQVAKGDTWKPVSLPKQIPVPEIPVFKYYIQYMSFFFTFFFLLLYFFSTFIFFILFVVKKTN